MQLNRDAIFFHIIEILCIFCFLRIVLVNHRAIQFIKKITKKSGKINSICFIHGLLFLTFFRK